MPALLEAYQIICRTKTWEEDPAQVDFLSTIEPYVTPQPWPKSLFYRRTIKGIYLYGRVGRGKTALMQLVYETMPYDRKKYAHFHDFMQNVHQLLQTYATSKDKQPIEHVIETIAKEAKFLCLDELHVTEIANAMLISRLFEGLLKAGVFVFFTSNQKPEHLYYNQLHHERFQPFVDLVQKNFYTYHLENKDHIDYRSKFGQEHWMGYTLEETAELIQFFDKLTGGEAAEQTLVVQEHPLRVPLAANGVAKFSFHEVCGLALGVADYLAIARTYHTIFVENVPILTDELSNEIRRFINLIDTLYSENNRLVLSMQAPIEELFQLRSPLPFQRTISRLKEMLAWGS